MSDFMKSIVQEVMKPYQKPKENPLFGGETRYLQTKSVTETKANEKQNIPGINRPNYQREKMQKRLSAIGSKSFTNLANNLSKKEETTKNKGFSQPSRGLMEGPLSKLQTMSLVQGNNAIRDQQTISASSKNRLNGDSQFIGQTRDGVKAWVFKGLHSSLQASFQRSLKSNSIGVITSDKCTAVQLFLLNEVLREFTAIKYCLTWDKESKQSFVLELYEEDEENLTKAVRSIFQKLSQNSYKQIQAYKAQSPSPWLTKQLDIKTHVNGVAVLEGVEYYSSILLLDRFLKKVPETNIGYSVEKNYLLLHGNYEMVSQVSDQLQKEAERLN